MTVEIEADSEGRVPPGDGSLENDGSGGSATSLDQRMAAFDGDDLVVELVDEIVAYSMLRADAVYVERRLTTYAARHVADQLFAVIAACEPTVVDAGAVVSASVQLTRLHEHEEPPPCVIDAACRLQVRSKQPPPPARPTPPSTPRKSKRLMVATSLAASSLLANNASGSSLPWPRSSAAKPGTPSKTSSASSGPVPGVPYSTAPPVATESPRKSVALLKTAMRLASASATSPLSATARPGAASLTIDEDTADESDLSTDADSDIVDATLRRTLSRKAPQGAPMSPTATTLSSHAWSITLPGDPSTREDAPAPPSASVDVEFVLPERLPLVGRRRSSAVSTAMAPLSPDTRRMSRGLAVVPSRETLRRRGTFLQLADEREAVEIDPMGVLGFDMREQLALSPGVKLQAETGELVKSGPQLPEVPTRMRRATFIDESLAIASLATVAEPATTSPARLVARPSTVGPTECYDTLRGPCASIYSGGVFSLAERASATLKRTSSQHPPPHYHHNASTRSLAISHSGSAASSSNSTTTSVKSNLFRKPAKVARPCTAACTHARTDSCAASAPTDAPQPFADLVKQRAFQRKPSVLAATTSPPKRAPSRRSVVNSSAASPLARRSLRGQTTDDPLANATKLL